MYSVLEYILRPTLGTQYNTEYILRPTIGTPY